MDRQSTIAFILIGVILVFWLYMNAPEPQPIPPQTSDSTAVVNKAQEEVYQEEEKVKEQESKINQINETEEAFLSSAPEQIITVETDLALIELTSKGARIRKFYLKEYRTWYYTKIEDESDFYNRHVQLINTSKEGGDFNIVFVTKSGQLVNTKNLDFNLDKSSAYYKVDENDSLSLSYTYDAGENKSLTKHFLFYGSDYNSKVDIILNNMDDLISSYRYDVEWSNGLNFVEKNSVDEANYSNAAAYSGDEKIVIDASSEGETVEKVMNGKIDWIGVRNKYFTVIIAPENPSQEGGADFKGEHFIGSLWYQRSLYR